MKFYYKKIEKCLEKLSEVMVTQSVELNDFKVKECDYKKSDIVPEIDGSWRDFKKGDRLGGVRDGHCWIYSKVKTIEENMTLSIRTGKECDWDAINPQFIVYIDGEVYAGLDMNHTGVILPQKKEYDIHIYAWGGMGDEFFEFYASLKKIDPVIEKLYYDIKVPYDILAYLQPYETEYVKILKTLDEAINLIDFCDIHSERFYNSINAALDYLEKEFYQKQCGKQDITTVCIGHTHIDVAWLWTLAQTREKAIRSFATVVNLMEKYPEYKFMSSQAQLYKFIKEESPALYEKIKKLIREGRWEVEGSMWVEADCNLSSGESLVRQILFGKRFFKEEFGVDTHILWLPDVFGYSAALPQILQKSGVDIFMTSKISWNETNQLPYDTFMWKGIDGTEILSYFLTAQENEVGKAPTCGTKYNAVLKPSHVSGAWKRYQQKDLTDEVFMPFGFGDGGGGPTSQMLETQRRLEKGIPGCPKTRIDTSNSFFSNLKERVQNEKKLPKWVGELYLELHRGTYTSQAKNKRYNRKSEFLYQTAEAISAINMILNNAEYPKSKINSGWEKILLNQFHDIIPGSSIKEVYDDSIKQYEEITEKGNEIINDAVTQISQNINTDGGLFVFNPLPFENSSVVEVEGEFVYVENVPSKGYSVVDFKNTNSVKVTENILENKFFTIKIDNGDIISIYDRINDREVIQAGKKANVLQAFEDFPVFYDAWEISSYYKDKVYEITDVQSIETFSEGARAGLLIKRKFFNSVIAQKICLFDEIPRIDFDTYIDWKEKNILLKALFPIDVHSDKAVYDIQFGTLERQTHKNTSWDSAKFEVCAHKFADVSEDDYGVSLLNDCKYGYDIAGNDMRITLLKSATYPDPTADKCEHRFIYSLYPHKGDYKRGGTVQEALRLNVPMYTKMLKKQTGKLQDKYSFVNCDCENIVIDTVKKTEDENTIIIRMYETYNRRSKAKLEFGFEFKEAVLTDMMENEIKALTTENNSVLIDVKPFEIVTIKIIK